MFQVENYTTELLECLKSIFGSRLVYLGLQGSYLRNEQQKNSDIDIMAVIENLTAADLSLYQNALIEVGNYDKSCGFICGKEELARWNPLEICHLLHTTKDLYGSLSAYLPQYTAEDEKNFVRLSIGNLYHEVCHRYVHSDREENIANLPLSYKPVFFILQNLIFLEDGVFYASKKELSRHLKGQDREVFAMLLKLQCGGEFDFEEAFDLLLSWLQNTLIKL